MSSFFLREIEYLKRGLLQLSDLVQAHLRDAVQAIEAADAERAKRVIDGDREVDEAEVRLEEECLKILALHQPVANDLRFIVSVLKINNDLERIGDLATNIAQRALHIGERMPLPVPFDMRGMAEEVQWMVRASLDAFVQQDLELANRVLERDDTVDDIHRETYKKVESRIRENKDEPHFETVIRWLSISRSLERIADHATNIAEDAIYMHSGDIVRHQHAEERENPEA